MIIGRIVILGVAALISSGSESLAGPCAAAIEQTRGRVQALLEAEADAGVTAQESTRALMHRQPTPTSIAAAEENLGELNVSAFDLVERAIARAGEYDQRGDKVTCERALADANNAICLASAARDPLCR